MTSFRPASPSDQHQSDVVREPSGTAFEPHFTPKEIAKIWRKDEDTIRKIFRSEPGVLCFESMSGRRGVRSYVSLTIPESVVARVHQRLEIQANKTIGDRDRKRHTASFNERIRTGRDGKVAKILGTSGTDDERWEREVLRTAGKVRPRK